MSESIVTGVKVYEAINAVSADLSRDGIGKNRTNESQKFKFRGIDDVYNALSGALVKHKLVIMPRFADRVVTERTSKNGVALFYVCVKGILDFISSEDGSKHTVEMYGEAMDSGDKATNKAMSAAYKYAAFQTFCIPTEAMPDADADATEPIMPAPASPAKSQAPTERDAAPSKADDDKAFKAAVANALIKNGYTLDQTPMAVKVILDLAGNGAKELKDIPNEDRRKLVDTIKVKTFNNPINAALGIPVNTEAPPDSSNWAKFFAWMMNAAGDMKPADAEATLAKLKLQTAGASTRAGSESRKAISAAVAAGNFDWSTATIKQQGTGN